MKYYSEDDVRELVSETESMYLFAHSTPISVRYCRDCPYFISDYIPDEEGRYSGANGILKVKKVGITKSWKTVFVMRMI